jgi:hypothetical protein
MKDGGPAFPKLSHSDHYVSEGYSMHASSDGMSLRDYFAAAALNGILSNDETMRQGVLLTKDMKGVDSLQTVNSLLAYAYADAMLKARASNRG